jgi:hypothetical protein
MTQPDAIELLEDDHRACDRLFAEYRDLVRHEVAPAQRKALADRICLAVTIHGKLEEELFYPAAREALRDDDVIDDAEASHDSAKELVAQLLAMRPQDPLYDAKVAVLAQYVEDHARHEQVHIFPLVRATALDLRALARSLMVRKAELSAVAEALREDALASAA